MSVIFHILLNFIISCSHLHFLHRSFLLACSFFLLLFLYLILSYFLFINYFFKLPSQIILISALYYFPIFLACSFITLVFVFKILLLLNLSFFSNISFFKCSLIFMYWRMSVRDYFCSSQANYSVVISVVVFSNFRHDSSTVTYFENDNFYIFLFNNTEWLLEHYCDIPKLVYFQQLNVKFAILKYDIFVKNILVLYVHMSNYIL